MKRLLLIDGHSLAYRAYFALPVENFSNSQGQATNAIYGFGSMLVNLIASEKPTHIAVAFDVSRKTFRSEKFPAYKATRSATPDEFRSQMGYLQEFVTNLGIRFFSLEGYEADDILATISTRAVDEEFDVLIASGDRDSFQLVNEKITVLYPKKGVGELARMTPTAVQEKYGLTPKQYPDFAALRGDPSDNLPSIPGVGEKTATKLIVEYGTLDELLAHKDEISGKVGDALRAHVDEVKLNRELTALRHDVPVDFSMESIKWFGPNIEKVDSLLSILEIKALKEKIHSLVAADLQEKKPKDVVSDRARAENVEISESDLLRKIEGLQNPISLYFAGNTENYPFGVALSVNEVYTCNFPLVGVVLKSAVPKVLHGAKVMLRNYEIENIIFDTELAGYILNPGSRNLAVSDLGEKYLGRALSEESADLFTPFNPDGASIILELHEVLASELKERSLDRLFFELEMPTMFALSELERTGIALNQEKLLELQKYFQAQVEYETAAAHAAVGHEFNVASPKQLQIVLFEELGLPKTKKIKTGFTTDAESLQGLFVKTKHPLLNHLLRIRETSKLLTTVEGLQSAISQDGRIHTTLQQTIAATGRLSSTDPNLQNIPVRTEEGRRIRDCFTAQQPYVALLTADYSQIEMRIMAHLSRDDGLIAAFKSGEDLHSSVASLVFGVNTSEVDAEMRRQIKAMSYGLAYGLSAYGLSQQLDLSPPDAQVLMNTYFERFGGIQDYLKTVVLRAREKGFTETILGRRRYLPDLNSENRARREVAERMALNAPIQGSAADIIKLAMLHVLAKMNSSGLKSRLLLQVHDELIFEIFPGEIEILTSIVKFEMESAVELSVPLAVNIGSGFSWADAAH